MQLGTAEGHRDIMLSLLQDILASREAPLLMEHAKLIRIMAKEIKGETW